MGTIYIISKTVLGKDYNMIIILLLAEQSNVAKRGFSF